MKLRRFWRNCKKPTPKREKRRSRLRRLREYRRPTSNTLSTSDHSSWRFNYDAMTSHLRRIEDALMIGGFTFFYLHNNWAKTGGFHRNRRIKESVFTSQATTHGLPIYQCSTLNNGRINIEKSIRDINNLFKRRKNQFKSIKDNSVMIDNLLKSIDLLYFLIYKIELCIKS